MELIDHSVCPPWNESLHAFRFVLIHHAYVSNTTYVARYTDTHTCSYERSSLYIDLECPRLVSNKKLLSLAIAADARVAAPVGHSCLH
eukprot:COSAG01_NODE_3869_length_5605_cov_39.512713_3_plen_88_part_00